ncbi:glycosyltransferase family 1 protein [Nocardioides sp. HM23]|uniref:glycosyltransferase family 4 protein n=1 Tax=Nocardioides bizhenqiangii TaxID=3095076 RepID=UPI002ACA45C8|nr:glycosyltransferase family 1 protein [Nocardioides sp. HM23]MDZ5619998.1 glycosyltransferase family 1 protein [Nocardioides sp. HM23]
MHLVVDAVAVRPGSAAIVIEHLLRGWREAAPDDRVTVLADGAGPAFAVPDPYDVVPVRSPAVGPVGAAWLRSWGVRRAARALRPDAVLSAVPATGLAGYGARRGLILYDLRHELRPHQFSWRTRLSRRLSWGWTMSRSDGIYTISERTLTDLRDRHPRLARLGVAAQLGADHVDDWPTVATVQEAPYALAFGHFANKNVDAVIEGWAQYCRTADPSPGSGRAWRLRLVGMGSADRAAARERVAALGVADRVELMPWLDDAAFQECFAGAGLVIFPSDFEGFGLPAIEAMRLGIPVVVSDDPALAEVTGGHAAVARSTAPADLAAAVTTALQHTPEQLDAGRRFTDGFSWRRTAGVVRASLLEG